MNYYFINGTQITHTINNTIANDKITELVNNTALKVKVTDCYF